MKYRKYKSRVKLILTGDDNMFASNQSSTYQTTGSTYTNGVRIRFNLNSVSKKITYEDFVINFYHNETKVLYVTSLCRIEICIKSEDKRHDRLYRNEYLQDKECQNTVEKIKNEIKEYVKQYNQN